MVSGLTLPGRGPFLHKLGSNDPMTLTDVSDAVVFSLVLDSHHRPTHRATLESLTYRILLSVVHATTIRLGHGGSQAPDCV